MPTQMLTSRGLSLRKADAHATLTGSIDCDKEDPGINGKAYPVLQIHSKMIILHDQRRLRLRGKGFLKLSLR